MPATPIIILHSPEDAQDAFVLAREMTSSNRKFTDGQVRLLTAAQVCRLPLGFDRAQMIFISSVAAVNSLAISRVLNAFLENAKRDDVFVVGASSAGAVADEMALISPLLSHKRSPKSGLLERSTYHRSLFGDLRSESVGVISERLEQAILRPSTRTSKMSLAQPATMPKLGTNWAWRAGMLLLICLFSVTLIVQQQQFRISEIAAQDSNVAASGQIVDMESGMSFDARREINHQTGNDVVELIRLNYPYADEVTLAQYASLAIAIGDAREKENELEAALDVYSVVAQITARRMGAAPANPERVLDHARAIFRIGELNRELGHNRFAERAYHEFSELTSELLQADPENPVYVREKALAGIRMTSLGLRENALEQFGHAGNPGQEHSFGYEFSAGLAEVETADSMTQSLEFRNRFGEATEH